MSGKKVLQLETQKGFLDNLKSKSQTTIEKF